MSNETKEYETRNIRLLTQEQAESYYSIMDKLKVVILKHNKEVYNKIFRILYNSTEILHSKYSLTHKWNPGAEIEKLLPYLAGLTKNVVSKGEKDALTDLKKYLLDLATLAYLTYNHDPFVPSVELHLNGSCVVEPKEKPTIKQPPLDYLI